MKRFPLLLVAALFGLAVSAPAQLSDNGRSARKSRGSVATSQQSQRGHIVNRSSSRSVRSATRATSSSRSQRAQRSTRSSRNVTNSRSSNRSSSAFRRGQSVVRSAPARSHRSNRSNRVARGIGNVVRALPTPRVSIGFNRYNPSCGRWETRCEQVLVPGYWDVQHCPAVFGWVYDSCGRRHWGVTEPARDHRVWVPARYETRNRRVWVRH